MGKLFLKIYSETLEKGKARYIEPQTAQGIVFKFLSVVSKRKRQTNSQEKNSQKKRQPVYFARTSPAFRVGRGVKKGINYLPERLAAK